MVLSPSLARSDNSVLFLRAARSSLSVLSPSLGSLKSNNTLSGPDSLMDVGALMERGSLINSGTLGFLGSLFHIGTLPQLGSLLFIGTLV
jgi:hypothetical protein